ncbi:MAG: HlyC/CorC family transporter [Deltaproteobacteria bacterium]|nr:HlyC/CorC family transporter [Deltaproteobacteria bacterium]MBW1794064.1 HlyC/CorC family transporter [Deltaproteobacteria bacterium]MBW2329766.1 HlyC/CorC family transporter [Deltaproteobacteria bacterium]
MMLEIVMLLVCILGSGFGSGSETALVSASRTRLQHMTTEGVRRARLAIEILNQRERILTAILIVTNIFNIAGGAIATVSFQRWAGSLAPIVATLVMTSVLLVISEIVPKAYFRHHADGMMVKSGAVWRILSWILAPITFPVQILTNLVFRLFRSRPRSLYTTREEIKLILEESVERGGLGRYEQEMLESTLDYATTIVREVMVPISEVALLLETAHTRELIALVRERGHTRIPVYRERVDQIVGLVNVFDVLYDKHRKTFIRPYMRPARLVPDTKGIDELFLEMQRARESLTVVVNEFGACIGIVALEDIIEEIFGELADEHEDLTPEIQKKGPGRFRVSARTDIDDLNDETGLAISKVGFETVGGYVLHHLGRIPRKGETFTDGDLTVHVVEADRYGVKMVELIQREPESSSRVVE